MWQFDIHWLEIAASFFGLINVYLVARVNIWNWLSGLLGVSLYLIIFYQVKLYADMSLQMVFFMLQIYGCYQWLYGGKQHTALAIRQVPESMWKWLILAGLAGAAVISWILKCYTDSTWIALDVTTTTLSLIAQWQMSKKYVEHWLVWIVVDIISIYMYLIKHLYVTAGLYAVFLLMSILSYRYWKTLLDN